jgi:endonuclease III
MATGKKKQSNRKPTATGASEGVDSRAVLRRRAHRIAQLLHAAYGSPRHGNKDDPLDELVFILLSQMTTGPSFNRVYDCVKAAYPTWEPFLAMPVAEVKATIKDAGLSGQKAPGLKTIFQKVKDDFGAVTLQPLADMTDQDAERYLTNLPRVGIKTAKCVMMYALGRQVLPVDTHVWRVTRRLGLVGEDVPYTKVHEALEAVVPPPDRYWIHVNGVAHGRAVCFALRPRCASCPLKRICPYPAAGAAPQT